VNDRTIIAVNDAAVVAEDRLFYGWVILAAAVVIGGVGMGVLFSLAVFLRPIAEAMGWGRTGLSSVAAVNWITMGLGSLLWGMLSDRIGTRKVVLAGGCLVGLGMVLSSQITAVWQLYLTFSLLTGLGVSAFYAPLSSTATRWFTKNRGLALGIVSAGMGVGILVMSPLTRWLISLLDWRWAMLILGDLAWLIIIPVALLVRDSPEEMGVVALGGSAMTSRDVTAQSPGAVFGTSTFWVIALTHFACCAAHSGPIFHMVAYATDQGLDKMVAASLLGVSGLSSIVGRIGGGLIADRVGVKQTLLAGLALQALMVLLYRFASDVGTFYALGLVFGVSYGTVMPLYALIVRDRFGERVMGRAYGGVFFVSSLGMAVGAYAGGWVYDHLGNYAWLYLGSFLIGAMAVLLALALRAPRPLAAPV
jgi:MFS family permease